LNGLTRLVAIATDERLETEVRQFSLDDVKGLADLLESGFILPNLERISLYVNGKPVVLTDFPRKIITSIMLALVSSLKGIGVIRSLDIRLRRKPE
jgi:molybdopterin-guanine dinucleotide biosynthesis protein B